MIAAVVAVQLGTLVVAGRVVIGAEEMERHIKLVADNPAVVPRRARRDVEDLAGAHLDHVAVSHRRGCAAGYDHSDMLDLAVSLALRLADMLRLFPAGLVGCPADSHAVDANDLELAE